MKKGLFLTLAAMLLVPLGMRAQITSFPYTESFENDFGGWTLIDADGDGYNWTRVTYNDITPPDGSYFVYSQSYDNSYGVLTPDNWMVSPEIVLGDEPMVLSWYTKVQDVGYPEDHYAVYVSTTGASVSDFTDEPIFEITLSSAYADWVKNEVSLADYAGQTVHIAFRHYDCSDWYIFFIDAITIDAPAACATPTSLAVNDITSSSATLTFDYGSSWDNANIYLNGELYATATTGTVDLTGLDYGTTYSVWVEGACSDNQVSDQAVTSFTTECAVISEFPYTFGFETSNANCYSTGLFNIHNGDQGPHTGIFHYYAGADTSMPTMVTPTFQLPSDGDGYIFGVWLGTYNASYASGDVTFSLMISTEEGEGYDESFESLLDTFIANTNANYAYHEFRVPVGSYAGETVRFALRYTAVANPTYNYRPSLYVDDFYVRDASAPVPAISGPTATDVDMENVFTASLVEGIEDGLVYEWISARVEAGEATMDVDGENVTIVYTAAGIDTLTVVASNVAGSMSATVYVLVRDCSAITSLPWSVVGDNEDEIYCWTIVDNNDDGSTWQTSSYNYLYEPYTSTSDDWAITQAIAIPEDADGIILQWEDYLSTYSGTDGHYEVYISPIGSTALESFTDTVFEITGSNNAYVLRTISLNAYAGMTIRIAFRHLATADDNGLRLRNFTVRMALAPTVSIDGPMTVDANTTENFAAVIMEGALSNIAYQWTSSMAAVGNATLDGENDSVASIEYGAIEGYDTVTLVVTNDYGRDSVAIVVRVRNCAVITAIPWAANFDNEQSIECWTIVDNNNDNTTWEIDTYYAGSLTASYANTSDDWAITPAIQIPEGAEGLIVSWEDYLSQYNGGIGQYNVYVSPTGSAGISAFSDTIFSITESNNFFVARQASLDDYAGTTVRIAFHHVNNVDDNGMRIRNVMVRFAMAPLVSIEGPTTADVNTTVDFSVVQHEGATTNIVYQWTSTMADAGFATLTGANDTIASIAYGANVGYDTVTLVVTNDYGHDSASVVVRVRDLAPVTELPYSCDFEDETENTGWELVSNAGENEWYIGGAVNNGGSKSLYISSTGGASNTYTISSNSIAFAYRAFDFTQAGEYAIQYDWRANGESTYDFIRAFVAPSTTDLTAFSSYSSITYGSLPDGLTAIDGGDRLNETNTWETFAETFSITTPGVYMVVFCWRNDGSVGEDPAGAIDNVELSILTCPRPTDLTVSDITTTSATVSWTAVGEESQWMVIVDGTETATVSTESYDITGLTSSSQHSVEVIALCSDEDHSFAVSTTFRTLCEAETEFPWTEDFESYASYEFPGCWTRFYGCTSGSYVYPYVNTYTYHSGARATTDYLYDSYPSSMIATPMFATAANTLRGSVWVRGYEYYYDYTTSSTIYEGLHFEIGVMTDAADTSTFVTIFDTVISTYDDVTGSNSWEEINFSAEASGVSEHAMVAFRVSLATNSATGYFYIDDVTINNDGTADTTSHTEPGEEPGEEPGTEPEVVCNAPVLGEPVATADSITISWSGEAASYEVSAVAGSGVQEPAISTAATTYTFSQLEAGTTYTISVRAVCDDTTKSEWASVAVKTAEASNGIESLEAVGIGIYPNPASDHLTVDLGDVEAYSVQMIDQSGRVVMSRANASGKVVLDVRGIAAGVYFVRVTNEQGIAVGRIVVR